jgi:hypothetical protein
VTKTAASRAFRGIGKPKAAGPKVRPSRLDAAAAAPGPGGMDRRRRADAEPLAPDGGEAAPPRGEAPLLCPDHPAPAAALAALVGPLVLFRWDGVEVPVRGAAAPPPPPSSATCARCAGPAEPGRDLCAVCGRPAAMAVARPRPSSDHRTSEAGP